MLRRLPLLLLALLPACAGPGAAPTASRTAPDAGRATVTSGQVSAARQRFREEFFSQYDANRDSTVTRAEYDAERERMFQRTDADRNGTLSSGEYVAEYRGRLTADYAGRPEDEHFRRQIEQAVRRFEAIDRDRDGAITRTEYRTIAAATFGRIDADHDGRITGADFDTAPRSHP